MSVVFMHLKTNLTGTQQNVNIVMKMCANIDTEMIIKSFQLFSVCFLYLRKKDGKRKDTWHNKGKAPTPGFQRAASWARSTRLRAAAAAKGALHLQEQTPRAAAE